MLLSSSLYAKSNTEKLGDILQIAIPSTAYATTLYLDDKEGQMEFYKAYGITLATTNVLKYGVREQRPDSDTKDSFPSGHTSVSFFGASFIHKRYGFEYAVIPYIGAIYTGYSRVHSKRHYTHDVIAGAIVGIASSWYFATSYKNLDIKPMVGTDYKGVEISYRW
ncbi:Membrane-associated phospholipid phosphatase [hydrothermal vent metagenome]|uniref:Membrane-associated phospholipid phosphatase n=1 Tax=hydrothermal vent metagenome TaxID=652676 RepID=A0A1W1BZT7_9ZZZZ